MGGEEAPRRTGAAPLRLSCSPAVAMSSSTPSAEPVRRRKLRGMGGLNQRAHGGTGEDSGGYDGGGSDPPRGRDHCLVADPGRRPPRPLKP